MKKIIFTFYKISALFKLYLKNDIKFCCKQLKVDRISDIKRYYYQFFNLITLKALSMLMSVASTLMIAKILGVQLRGEYGFVIVVTNNVSLIFSFGLGNHLLANYNSHFLMTSSYDS